MKLWRVISVYDQPWAASHAIYGAVLYGKIFILCTTISQCHLIIDGIFIVSLPIKVKSIKYFKGWTSPLTMQGLYKCMETVFRYQKISLNENKVNISLY